MPAFFMAAALSFALAQTPAPPNPACTLLTTAQVSSLIGAAKAAPISSVPAGSTCLLQERDKLMTVLIVNAASPEIAKSQWDSKKRIMSGQDVAGWGVPAYLAVQGPAAVVGLVKGTMFIEVKATDPAQKPDALGVRLQAVMKDVAARK